MKKFIVVTFLFIFIISVKCYAQEQVPVMTSSQLGSEVKSKCTSGQIANVINDSDNPVEILKAILVCVRDIDIYLQFFVVIVISGVLLYITVLKPLLNFLK